MTPGIACAPGPSPCPCARPSHGPCAGRVCADRAGPEPTKGGTELIPIDEKKVYVCRWWVSGDIEEVSGLCGERIY